MNPTRSATTPDSSRRQVPPAPLQERPLGAVAGEGDGRAVGDRGVAGAAEAAEQLGPRGVEQVVAAQADTADTADTVDAVENGEGGGRPVDLGQGDRPVEGDHRG